MEFLRSNIKKSQDPKTFKKIIICSQKKAFRIFQETEYQSSSLNVSRKLIFHF